MSANDTIKERALKYRWSPFTRTRYVEEHGLLPIVRGKGSKVYDIDDREYIDAHASLWLVNAGYGRQEIVEAAYRQMQTLPWFSCFEGFTNLPSVELAERLVRMLEPEGMDKVFFSGSGSEAVETALKIARQYWKLRSKAEKYKVISRSRAYHGVTLGALSATGMAVNRAMFEPLLPGFRHAPCPDPYLREVDAPDEGFGKACAEALERVIRFEGPHTVAAIIVEPVQGAGGVIVPPEGYLRELREIATRHDVLLIFDEVITGFGRTGDMFGARHWGVSPDIMTFAKGITSGYLPLGATAVRQEVFETFYRNEARGAFRHGNTYSGHPTACAAALANLDIIENEDLAGNARRIGSRLLDGLKGLAKHEIVGFVDGVGLLGRVQLVRDRKTRALFAPELAVADRISRRARELGVIFRPLPNDALSFSPPLCLTAGEADTIVGVIDQAIGEVAKTL
ncbi:MAG: aspartate aminotransferase family protein [Rhodospirillales bacterium]|nr:aspartate aminotransferase family protein [Rhodospirillales bacterium]